MSLIQFKAKNHRQQVNRRGADDTTDDRRTPPELWNPLHAEFRFTLDVAATAENAKVPKYCVDGLAESWTGERVWCNPPYSGIGAWLDKAWDEYGKGCPLIVMLVPANRTEQAWWQAFVEPCRDKPDGRLRVRFLRGRLRFDRPGWTKPAKGDRPPFGCCLLIWTNQQASGSDVWEMVDAAASHVPAWADKEPQQAASLQQPRGTLIDGLLYHVRLQNGDAASTASTTPPSRPGVGVER